MTGVYTAKDVVDAVELARHDETARIMAAVGKLTAKYCPSGTVTGEWVAAWNVLTEIGHAVLGEEWPNWEPMEAHPDQSTVALRQALWDVFGILGFDQDGDRTPAGQVNLIGTVLSAARQFREDADETDADFERLKEAL